MARSFSALAALPLLLIALAASAPAAPVPDEAKHTPLYWPTKVGTRLVYLRDEPPKQYEETWEVTKVEDRAGGKSVTTEYVRAGGVLAPHQTAVVTPAGASVVADNGVAYDPPWPLLKVPHKRGENWDIPARIRQGVTGERMVVVGSEVVTVPAGRFEAVVVEWQNSVTEGWPKYAYAPGVGLVRLTRPDGSRILALKAVIPPR